MTEPIATAGQPESKQAVPPYFQSQRVFLFRFQTHGADNGRRGERPVIVYRLRLNRDSFLVAGHRPIGGAAPAPHPRPEVMLNEKPSYPYWTIGTGACGDIPNLQL